MATPIPALGSHSRQWLLMFSSIFPQIMLLTSASALCELGFIDNNKLYNYSLAAPVGKFRHGILSEDGFYKVAANDTVIWFQLCDGMIFNHDPPTCLDCSDCGGPLRCGMGCSALVANNDGGYPVCSTVGHHSGIDIHILDKKNPHLGIILKMSSTTPMINCSLSVTVICDEKGVQGPHSLEILGDCDYATSLRHPSGCASILHVHGKGLGWFATLISIVMCLFGAYMLAGVVYRFFYLGIRGVDVIPNLDFWISLPHKIQSWFGSLVRRFRGPSQGYRSSYSPVNF